MRKTKQGGWGWVAVLGMSWLAWVPGNAAEAVYQQDFGALAPGELPDEFMELGGPFSVKESGGEKYLELGGAPLESFGVMFGPAHAEDWGVQARIQGTGKGRRFPVFGLGLAGVGGYRLEVVPAKKALELSRGEERLLASVPFAWTDGAWTWLRLRIRRTGEGAWRVEGKAWREGTPEPETWAIGWDEKEAPFAQRASLWGKSFSGTPIRYDDLVVWAGDK